MSISISISKFIYLYCFSKMACWLLVIIFLSIFFADSSFCRWFLFSKKQDETKNNYSSQLKRAES